jgi:Fe-S cluster assembly ATP-binding protein
MIEIKNLCVSVQDHPILQGVSLQIPKGETHVIMGPNGSGKSTLTKVLAGHPDYTVTSGEITLSQHGQQKDVLSMAPHERSLEGIFLSFQYPIEIPGITNESFLKTALNKHCQHQGSALLSDEEFSQLLKEKIHTLKMPQEFLARSLNEGFSGGEKKKNEILQLLMLSPRFAILDETDSGLDVDALQVVSQGINLFRHKNNSVLLVTHYQRLLNYVVPDRVHIMVQGKIIESGPKELALRIEKEGYDFLVKKSAP